VPSGVASRAAPQPTSGAENRLRRPGICRHTGLVRLGAREIDHHAGGDLAPFEPLQDLIDRR
jgi:hypothetical protein